MCGNCSDASKPYAPESAESIFLSAVNPEGQRVEVGDIPSLFEEPNPGKKPGW